MAKSSRQLAILYGLIGLIELLSEFTRESFPMLHYLSKPLLMPVLLLYFRASWSGSLRERSAIIMQLAIVFSWLGDVFLMLTGEQWFIPGLGSFLVAQLLYAYLFSRDNKGWLTKNPGWIAPFVLYAGGLLYLIWPGLGALWVPVCIYASAIMLMAVTALNRKGVVSQQSFQLVLIGAILFVISDSFIAINKFAYPFEASRLVIMGTYISAQFLIVVGYVKSRR
jgi:uncharacterized membrane protein YhhN